MWATEGSLECVDALAQALVESRLLEVCAVSCNCGSVCVVLKVEYPVEHPSTFVGEDVDFVECIDPVTNVGRRRRPWDCRGGDSSVTVLEAFHFFKMRDLRPNSNEQVHLKI